MHSPIKLLRHFGAYSLKQKGCMYKLSEKPYDQDMAALRERVVRLEVQITELTKRVDGLTSYTRQLFEYLRSQ